MSTTMSAAKAQQIATSAKEKMQGMWTSIRSITFDEDGDVRSSISKIRKAMAAEPPIDSGNAWESMMKTMFGSCTTGVTEEILHVSPSNSSRSSKSPSCDPAEPLSPSREKEEFFYSQFLSNEHVRAQHAVSSLRETAYNPRPVERKVSEKRTSPVPKPFPVSSPPRKDHTVPPVLVQEIVPPTHRAEQHCEINGAISFDDGISAISAHTLEEMARLEEIRKGPKLGTVRSDLTSEGFETIDGSQSFESSLFPKTPSPKEGQDTRKLEQQVDLTRGNSRMTYTSRRSAGTRSTRSTQTSDFENAWRRDELKYWQDVVEQDDIDAGSPTRRRDVMLQRVAALKKRSRSRESDSQNLKQTSTNTTAASSTISGVESKVSKHHHSPRSGPSFTDSPFAKLHPHETFPFMASDVLNTTVEEEEELITTKVVHMAGSCRNDPDRLQEILVLNHDTELGEI